MRLLSVSLLAALVPAVASAQIADECLDLADSQPSDYDEQVQQDFLANYVMLAMTYSPAHAPIPHEPGHGAIGVGLQVIPPLGCKKRFVLDWTKTEDTNKTPVGPVPRATFAFPKLGPLHLYAGIGYLPPLTLLGTRNVIFQGEFGVGVAVADDQFEFGGRIHAAQMKTVADAATAFSDDDPSILDLYLGSSIGFDLMAGYAGIENIKPYAAIGFTDVSTFFFIGDDGLVTNNLHPYAGMTFSVGVDALTFEKLRWGAEFYGAPGGYSTPRDAGQGEFDIPGPDKANYGSIYTARLRIGYEL